MREHHIHSQDEDDRKAMVATIIIGQLRAALSDALDTLGEEEAMAVIEQELQHKQRTH